MIRNLRSRSATRAFTLIELLTVMAITAILMTIIVVPLYQSFNMTRAGQAFAEAQDRAKIITIRISREIGNATSVRPTSGLVSATVNGVATQVPQSSVIVEIPQAPASPTAFPVMIEAVLPYSKIDIINPEQGNPASIGAGGAYIDPGTGLADPTLTRPKGQISMPVSGGRTIVRYFVGRRDPFADYNDPYDGLMMAQNARRDNLYVLYRAEVQPNRPGGALIATDKYAFFDTAADGTPLLDDPGFFIPNRDGAGKIITNDAKAKRIKNWLGVGPDNQVQVAIVQTELSRYDMIQPVYNPSTHAVTYDGNVPRVFSLVQFRPAHLSNDPAEGQMAARTGEETNNSGALAPDVYSTQFSLWDRPIVRNWPTGWDPNDPSNDQYNVYHGQVLASNPVPNEGPFVSSIFVYNPAVSALDISSGVEVWDDTLYQMVTAGGGRYPFSQAADAANTRSGWLGSNGLRNLFVPFTINSGRGRVTTSFGIWEIGNPAQAPPAANPQNLPTALTSVPGQGPYTPTTDPNTGGGNFYDAAFSTVNELFNKVWSDHTDLQPNVDRFIDLRMTPNADGSPSPLSPVTGFARARIVPGSEEVYGPDQLPGPDYGLTVRYTRVTQNPGPNQYRINYVDQPEPSHPDANGRPVIDYTVLGLTNAEIGSFNPAGPYDPTNLVSAVIQPRYKKGYLQFDSDPAAPLPMGQIMVSYRFQFNGAGNTGAGATQDTFAVDYDTRQLIDVLLTIRNYPQSSLPNPQTVTLKSTAAVRNFSR